MVHVPLRSVLRISAATFAALLFAVGLFAYDTIKKALDRTPWVVSHVPVPSSSIAGATAGVCSTLCTYPLELLKTRLTIQRGVYKNLTDAFVKICQEEGPRELYRGLMPSVIGVIPYAAANYYAYDFLRRLYKKLSKQEQVGNLATLLIGSTAGAFASASTFPLEVARKQMQEPFKHKERSMDAFEGGKGLIEASLVDLWMSTTHTGKEERRPKMPMSCSPQFKPGGP
ncbi:hypothetical protein GOP47_0007091 [Adiantum capillus-veneris]|uniref:Uncharacterized protein n=1 Tax=Adiantum capillus-veneris TaxID=13818 RepID=A0A9D4V0V2_ADICA|nr:hypothetical protein GOP47_0007091 [Adiantum capillus-veneris]